ncbi:hypothetical protein [Priestia flexa]|uniref:hypothetical protein n=1 Tax=Priestia flexa TaxID=86664 RepID=UPI0004742990|nr:hypothetical protein [Priestia flexa]
MEQKKLFESLDGLFAYDTGCTDSGIKDEQLREEITDYLHSLEDDDFRITLSTYIREYYVSEKAVEQGYGIEDVAEFINWLSDRMGIDL